MTLAVRGYRFKKDLKRAVGEPLMYTETSMFGPQYRPDGKLVVVGPSAHERKWFAEVTMKNGYIYKVT